MINMRRLGWVVAALLLGPDIGPLGAGQIDFDTYRLLQRGMSEAEVLVRAGPPDKINSFDVGIGGLQSFETVRQLFYIPRPGEVDPHLTVITTQGGRVSDIERTKLFSSPKGRAGGPLDFQTYTQLEIGMSEGELLAKAGPPDDEVPLERGVGGDISTKQYLYLPGPRETDPHLTVITIQNGRVVRIERTKIPP
jgi:hypothetical protein